MLNGTVGNWLDPLVAILVVANVIPILPTVLDIVSSVPKSRRRRITLRALVLGNLVAFLFALGGGALLGAIGSGIDDVRVAGGLILLIFAIYDLLFSREQRKEPLGEMVEDQAADPQDEVGLVPLGIPLLVGPATLATSLFLAEAYGIGWTALALTVNASVNAILILVGEGLLDRVGQGAMRATGKVFGLLLASMAVSMIRTGIQHMLEAA